MLITICDVPVDKKEVLEELGGDVRREWNGLIDVQFTEHKMYIRESYVKIRIIEHKSVILCDNEFGNIYIE